jgi:tripartite-type tricarboxylate transporter receptor subunit TctC
VNRRKLLIGAGALAGTGLATPAVFAQDTYPSKPIKLVIPFPAARPTSWADATARSCRLCWARQS